MEADLLRYYGIDLLDYYRGGLSRRRLRVLIQQLPRDAALARAVHGDETEWGLAEQLLANAVDQLATGNWMFATVNAAQDAPPPRRPAPIARPGVAAEPAEVPAATPDQIAQFFGAARLDVPSRGDDR